MSGKSSKLPPKSSMTPTETAQRILAGHWRHASSALRACQRGEWAAFAREVAPAKPLLAGRFDHGRCLELAERSLREPTTEKLVLVPLRACSTEDDVSTEWVAVHGVAGDGKLNVQETGPFIGVEDVSPSADALWECSVRSWTAATVVESRSYAPSIPMLLRAGSFAVLEMRILEVLSVEVHDAPALPRPVREVPMFSSLFEPRVGVSPELELQIREMCFVASDEDTTPSR
jgi:hypothetical protein